MSPLPLNAGSAATLITGLSAPIKTLEGDWLPDDHSGGGPMTMRTALRLSSNSAAVGMLIDIGIPTVIHAAERFGIESVPGCLRWPLVRAR